MGLDMYLSANKYISGWKHNGPEAIEQFKKFTDSLGMTEFVTPDAPSGDIKLNVAYWRKANHIHKWFVDNAQDGNDDCGTYGVSREQLQELLNLCQNVLDNPQKASEILPTQSGFFFGGTEYDEWYMNDLKNTIEQIDRALKCPEGWDFEYHSSW